MITIGNKKVKIIKSRVLKNGAIGAYVRYPDKSVKWRIIGNKNSISGGHPPSSSFSFAGPAYRKQKQYLKSLGIKPNRLKVKTENILNLISNKTNKNNIKTNDQKKYEYTKTQSDSFSNNNLFGMLYINPQCNIICGETPEDEKNENKNGKVNGKVKKTLWYKLEKLKQKIRKSKFCKSKFCKFLKEIDKNRSSVKSKYPPANYETNATKYEYQKKGFELYNTNVSRENIKNLISNKK